MGEGNIFSLCVSSHLDGGGTTSTDRGYPIPCPDGGYPVPGQDSGYPILLTGDTTIQDQDGGVPPIQDWMGYPHPVRRQISIASTCYAAGGMPLAFTQEDFSCIVLFSHGKSSDSNIANFMYFAKTSIGHILPFTFWTVQCPLGSYFIILFSHSKSSDANITNFVYFVKISIVHILPFTLWTFKV